MGLIFRIDLERERRLTAFFEALGLDDYAKRAKHGVAVAEEHPEMFKTVAPPKPTPPPQPTLPVRWRFAEIPEEAIAKRWRGMVMLNLHGELDGYVLWVRSWRIRTHFQHEHVMPMRFDIELLAEKREKRSHGWKTVASRKLGRDELLRQFKEVKVVWDDLEKEDVEGDEPDWMTDGRGYVIEHTPAPLEKENREIASELLMGSDEESWKEMDGN